MADFTKLNGYTVKDPQAVHTYDTVADLKADTKLKAGNHAQTKGYTTAGDGGHATYIIVDDNTLVDDGGSIHELTNGLKAVLQYNQINVKQFGVKSDGITDNTQRINAILSLGIKSLYFPDGEYLITEPITVNSCIHIEGESMRNTVIKAPNGFINWTSNFNYRQIKNLTIDGIEIDNNTCIAGRLDFSKISDLRIINYDTAISILDGSWINEFENIIISNCSNGLIHTGTNFNNFGFYNCYFQHIDNIAIDFKGSTVKFMQCNFENCNIVSKATGRAISFDSCYIENNTNIFYIDRASYISSIVVNECWLLASENSSNGWLANLYCATNVDTETASITFKNCDIKNRTADTLKPFAFNGNSGKSYWGVSLYNNRYQDIKTNNQYTIFYDDLFDTANCANYALPANPISFGTDLPLYKEDGIIWYKNFDGNMRGYGRTNNRIKMLGKYTASNTQGSITITPSKRYGCAYPTINNLPVTVRFTDDTYAIAKMDITASNFTITSIPYDSRTVAEVIFNNEYGTNIN